MVQVIIQITSINTSKNMIITTNMQKIKKRILKRKKIKKINKKLRGICNEWEYN